MGMTPEPQELSDFMAAIRSVESSNNYQAIGKDVGSKYGVAQGAYQIMSGIWPEWARAAGYSGLSYSDYINNVNNVQDRIAAHRMSYYYDRYDGRWDLVATAWFAGIGNADKAARGADLSGVNDTLTNVPTYVSRVISRMGSGEGTAPMPAGQGFTAVPDDQPVQQQQGEEQPVAQPRRAMSDGRRLAQANIEVVSNLIREGRTDRAIVQSLMENMFARAAQQARRQTTPAPEAQRPPTQSVQPQQPQQPQPQAPTPRAPQGAQEAPDRPTPTAPVSGGTNLRM